MKKRADEIYRILSGRYEGISTALNFDGPLQLLIATMLSAQCTDKTVNRVTHELFAKYPDLLTLAEVPVRSLEKDIHSCGFYRNKARNIKKAVKEIVDSYDSIVPSEMEDLLKLPGVARKTANIVLNHAFDKVEGIAVDTHVSRISRRLGLTAEKTPVKIEKDLMRIYDRKKWKDISNIFIQHGRDTCRSRVPRCLTCQVAFLCPSARESDNEDR